MYIYFDAQYNSGLHMLSVSLKGWFSIGLDFEIMNLL